MKVMPTLLALLTNIFSALFISTLKGLYKVSKQSIIEEKPLLHPVSTFD